MSVCIGESATAPCGRVAVVTIAKHRIASSATMTPSTSRMRALNLTFYSITDSSRRRRRQLSGSNGQDTKPDSHARAPGISPDRESGNGYAPPLATHNLLDGGNARLLAGRQSSVAFCGYLQRPQETPASHAADFGRVLYGPLSAQAMMRPPVCPPHI